MKILLITLIVLYSTMVQGQIILDTIDVSKMSKAQLRIVMKNYNKSLVIDNDRLKIQVKAEIRNNEIARKKYNDSLKGMNDYFKRQVKFKLDSAKRKNNMILDSISKVNKRIELSLKAKIKEEKIALRKLRTYRNIIIGITVFAVLLVLIILYIKRKLSY